MYDFLRTHRAPFGLRSGLVLAVVLLGCAPPPRNVPCSNDAQCEASAEEFKYCLQSRCVECVASSSCGEGNSCVDGECVYRCQDDRGCPAQRRCVDGTCAPQ